MGTALVTGATSGLGLEFAWQLAQARHDLVLVARTPERLREVAEEMRQFAGVQVEVLQADLSQRDELELVAERLREKSRPVGLLVNNAGFGLGQSFVGGDLAREEQALDAMVRAVMVASHAAAGAMVERGRGAILNVSSIAAHTVVGTYAAHKAWVLRFTEGLAVELAGTGVTATALCPGLVHTGFHAAAGIDETQWKGPVWLDAERVAVEGLAAVRRGQVICTPSLRYRSVNAALRLAPRWLVRRMADDPERSGRQPE
ncbi:SDR family NAD(P)-dependent oxidoreductase [Actinomyces sp. Marseille-P3109]|jgi:short-chain dehydrogenase/reductase SDR|uniref:SDR family NAD(P)-dependent oxidoreductase n=1 Tax=Actinomyces sp. Marseille-P3109 TaxID=2083009 RepID=UPI000D54BB01|nr:SDR family oxidoreductase [Actinomyces sp. Marseille-P3109]